MKRLISLFLVCIALSSCANLDVYEKSVVVPSQKWYYNNIPSFTFTITDTAAAYNLFIVLRHTDAYHYNNIWLNLDTKIPGGTVKSQMLDITLGSDAKGWEGNAMDDILEVRKNIMQGPVPFKKAGTYTFRISQVMRENPLRDVLNIGLRVEKVRM